LRLCFVPLNGPKPQLPFLFRKPPQHHGPPLAFTSWHCDCSPPLCSFHFIQPSYQSVRFSMTRFAFQIDFNPSTLESPFPYRLIWISLALFFSSPPLFFLLIASPFNASSGLPSLTLGFPVSFVIPHLYTAVFLDTDRSLGTTFMPLSFSTNPFFFELNPPSGRSCDRVPPIFLFPRCLFRRQFGCKHVEFQVTSIPTVS